MRVELSELASRDLLEIGRTIAAAAGKATARAVVERLERRCRALETMPHRGNVPPELLETGERGWREIHEPPYRLVYRVAGEVITIALIADARRDVRALLAERLLR